MIQFSFTAESKLFPSFLFLLPVLALAQLDILNELQGSSCSGKVIMHGFALEGNLKVVLSSLVQNVNKTGYNISSHGENADKVYGLAQCRLDLNASDCGKCASAAQEDLYKSCRRSSSGSVLLNGCFLRYANHNFVSQLSNTPPAVRCVNIPNRTNENSEGLDWSIANILTTVVDDAVSSNEGYSTGNEHGLYALAQCWRDLSMNQCGQCLDTVYKSLLDCPRGEGFTENCIIRYGAYKFYGDGVPLVSPSTGRKGRPGLPALLGLTMAGVVILLLLLLGVFLILKRKVIQHFYRKPLPGHFRLSTELSTAISKSKLNYKYSTLRAATKNFHPANKIGEGGFGAVYKGILPNGSEIAVKRLFTNKQQSVSHFFNEVTLISNVQHRNLVKLLGCSVDSTGCSVDSTDRLLVYEYLPNQSLDLFVFDENRGRLLDWQRRFEIILGIAAGLAYLHEESDIRIIHRDIKASNILLDQYFKPKIADFGLVRYFAEDQSHLNTTIVGTRGYMAPEYLVHGHLTEKVDVYAFGVLVLEIISGKRNKTPMYINDMPSLLTMVWNNYLSGAVPNIIDPNIERNCKEEVLHVVHVALLCTQGFARLRPPMSKVIMFLTSKEMDLPTTTQPPFVDVEYSQSSAYTSVTSAFASTPKTFNLMSNNVSTSATPMSLNTISTSSFGPR